MNIAGDAFEVSVVETMHPIHRMLIPKVGRFRVDEALVLTGIAAEPVSRSRRLIVAKLEAGCGPLE